jgi:hypothetical protein
VTEVLSRSMADEPDEPDALQELDGLEERLIARFSPPLRPDDVKRCLARSAASFRDARVRIHLPILVERAAVEQLQAIARQASPIHLVNEGDVS